MLNNGDDLHPFFKEEEGKMFGVLVVQNDHKKLGYLAGFSGNLGGQTIVPGFVPPIFDLLHSENYFLEEEKEITLINKEIIELESDDKLRDLKERLNIAIDQRDQEIKLKKEQIKINKLKRSQLRTQGIDPEILNQESSLEKYELKVFKKTWDKQLNVLESEINVYTTKEYQLKEKRKSLSQELQTKLFRSYQLLNGEGEQKSMIEVFEDFNNSYPPSASGECAAPKLFQYAFANKLKPIALAEFWWGADSKNVIRKHKNFYPACKSKCEPILNFMLKGLRVQKNPILKEQDLKIEIILEDDSLIVVNKPSELLSVKGKTNLSSVESWLEEKYPNHEEMKLVHRLDMSTSGILLIAKNAEIYKNLQSQFINREVEKEYVAILDGEIKQESGIIDFPMRTNFDDRPRQMLCREYGKEAKTEFEVLEVLNDKTRILFRPITGRTHQLRVHAAHTEGLNTPIEGDELYGVPSDRLKLHAWKLRFVHPVTKREIEVFSETPF